MKLRSISGGSVREADLTAAGDVEGRATAGPAESPFVLGVRRLRRSTTALIGVGIVAVLLVVALFADVLAPGKGARSRVTRPAPSSARYTPAMRWLR